MSKFQFPSLSRALPAALLIVSIGCVRNPSAEPAPAPAPEVVVSVEPRPSTPVQPLVVSPESPIKEFGTMWTFDAPPLEYWKARYDFTPTKEWLERVQFASVRLPGCSASLVSSKGLVMTNHHCARSCIEAVSPRDTNYNDVGFFAKTMADEKKCATAWVDQLQSTEDVTARINAAVTATSPGEQVAQRNATIAAIERECATTTGFNCQVVTFYQGGMYSLYRYKRYTDVRVVMNPEESIAFFGGDPDNFTYPRYDLDMTFYRVYENGQPLNTPIHLTWSPNGAEEGELVFMTGNPGSTGRLLTMAQMEYLRDVQYPAQIAGYERQLAILEELSKASPEAKRQYENQIFSLENAHKAVSGFLTGLRDSSLMAKKAAFEADFRRRIDADPALRAQYGAAWDEIASAQRQLAALNVQQRYHGFTGSQLLTLAAQLVRLPAETAKPDSMRLPAYRGSSEGAMRTNLLRDQRFNLDAEQTQLAAQLRAAQAELPAGDPYLRAMLAGRTPDAAAKALIEGTSLVNVATRKELLEGGAAAIAASSDPLIVAARTIDSLQRAITGRTAPHEAVISASAAKVGRAIFSAYGKTLPPDATFTLRITDGVVKGYEQNGTLIPPKTTFHGLYNRSAAFGNEPPFRIPARWEQRKGKLTMTTPYNFVSTNDIIGGNSGSPVINRQGQVVGLVFDGNIESLPNRFIFTDEAARAVSVHSEAIIEALRVMYDANRIADELEGKAM